MQASSKLSARQLERVPKGMHSGMLSGRLHNAHTTLGIHQQPLCGRHARPHCTQQGRENTTQPQLQSLTKDVAPEQFAEHKAMLERMAFTANSYQDLAVWVQRNEQDIIHNPSLAVLAMIRAVDLLSTLSDLDSLGEEQILEAVAAQEQVGEQLLPLLRQALPTLPLDTAASMAQAASLLDDSGYEESFYFTLVHTLQRAAESPPAPDQAGRLPCKPEVQGLNLIMLVGALARAGYYSPEAMDLLAKEAAGAVARLEPGMLASLVEGYMELQHLDQQLLTSVGRQLLQPSRSANKEGMGLVLGSLSTLEALQVALAFAFFNVQNAGFYQVLLARASSVMQQQQLQARAGEDDDDWQQLVLKLHMACTLAPGGSASVPAGARALLADEAHKHFQECRELAAEQAALVWDEEQGQGTQQLLEFQGLDLLATRQLTAVLALGWPPMHTRHTVTQQRGPQPQQPQQQGLQPPMQQHEQPKQSDQHEQPKRSEQHELPLQPELPMPCALVDRSAPWFTVDVALPGQDRVGVVVLPAQLFCRNMVRLRGNMQAQLRCMQALGWAIWPVSVEDWSAMVEQAAAASGVMDGYEGASSRIAQWIAYVAQEEREQILKRVEDAFRRPEEGAGGAAASQAAGQTSRATQEKFLQLLRPEERERTQNFFSHLQQNIWEGIDGAVSKRQQQQQLR